MQTKSTKLANSDPVEDDRALRKLCNKLTSHINNFLKKFNKQTKGKASKTVLNTPYAIRTQIQISNNEITDKSRGG